MSYRTNKYVTIGVVAALLASAGVWLAWPEPTSEDCDITVGYSRLRISLPVFVAQEHGMFERNGLDVCLQMYDTAQPLMQALVEGQVDVGGYTALPITYNGMIRSGTRLHFVTTMVEDQDHRISYLLRSRTPDGQQPSITSMTDLRGKRVGILPTVAYRAWLEAILRGAGVDPSEVTIQQVAPQLQPELLRSGGVDALFTNDPAATSALQLGAAEFVNDYVEVPKVLGEPFPFGSFNVSVAWADANPDQFRRLVRALDEAVLFVNAHPAEAKRTMVPYLPEVFRPHVEAYPNASYLPSWQSEEATFSKIAAQYREMGIIPSALVLSGLVFQGDPLEQN